MYKKVLLLGVFMFASNFSYGQSADTLFYGNTPNVAENPFGSGYIGGTNGYNDIGKYQRFDFESEVTVVGTRIHFAVLEMGGTAFDNVNIVVRLVEGNGSPGSIIHSKTINLSEANVGLSGNYIPFQEPVNLSGHSTSRIFIGLEWAASTDDTFAIYLDSNGEGNNAGRAWERFDNGSFNDFGTQLNPTFSWNRDADLWIAAVYTPVSTSIDANDLSPRDISLLQNYPNPFNPTTQIRFDLAESQKVTIRVYDVNGKMVSELVNGITYASGSHQVAFNGTGLSSGIYIYNMTTESGYGVSRKMVLIK
jgi:hypothetical protein